MGDLVAGTAWLLIVDMAPEPRTGDAAAIFAAPNLLPALGLETRFVQQSADPCLQVRSTSGELLVSSAGLYDVPPHRATAAEGQWATVCHGEVLRNGRSHFAVFEGSVANPLPAVPTPRLAGSTPFEAIVLVQTGTERGHFHPVGPNGCRLTTGATVFRGSGPREGSTYIRGVGVRLGNGEYSVPAGVDAELVNHERFHVHDVQYTLFDRPEP